MGSVHATRAGLPRGEWGVCMLLGQVYQGVSGVCAVGSVHATRAGLPGGEWGVCMLLGQVY